jgi:hypothetical protein
LGDGVYLQVNVPFFLLIRGFPNDLKDCCRKLIDVGGKEVVLSRPLKMLRPYLMLKKVGNLHSYRTRKEGLNRNKYFLNRI